MPTRDRGSAIHLQKEYMEIYVHVHVPRPLFCYQTAAACGGRFAPLLVELPGRKYKAMPCFVSSRLGEKRRVCTLSASIHTTFLLRCFRARPKSFKAESERCVCLKSLFHLLSLFLVGSLFATLPLILFVLFNHAFAFFVAVVSSILVRSTQRSSWTRVTILGGLVRIFVGLC